MRLRLLIATVLLAAAAAAQQFPTMERGFSATKRYSFGDLDSVNSFNGNLTLTIPIGPQYPVNGPLGYGLKLHYNSKVWDYEDLYYQANEYSRAVPNRDSNAGMGWLLDFGRLSTPADSSNTLPEEAWDYLSPDGGRHAMSTSGLHPNSQPTSLSGNVTSVGYTANGDYLRMLVKSNGTREIDTPDGIARTFNASTGDLTSISDPYGNSVNVSKYNTIQSTPCPYPDVAAWMITDSQQRTNWVCFKSSAYPESAYGGQMVDRVILKGPDNSTLTYAFNYTLTSMYRGCWSNYPVGPNPIPNVPMLTSLTFPDNSVYTFTYNEADAGHCDQGVLTSVTLPTQATISYTYRLYELPSIAACDSDKKNKQFYSYVVGVGQKTITGPNIPTATWQWNSSLVMSNFWVQCTAYTGPFEYVDYYRAPADQMITTITDPDQNVTEHYYSTWPGSESLYQKNPGNSYTLVAGHGYPVASEHGAIINEYGLPFTRLNASGSRYLSKRYYTAAGYASNSPLRSEYVRYEYDDQSACFGYNPPMKPQCMAINARVASTMTLYHDDDSRVASTDFFDFDGFGHYRRSITDGTFTGGNVRTSYADFNSGSDMFGNKNGSLAFSSSAKWVLSSYGDQWTNENGHTSKSENFFDGNGFLKAKRILTADAADVSGIAQSPNDVLALFFTDDGHGNLTKELDYGGDKCGVTIPGCAQAVACAPLGSIQTISPSGAPAYDIHYGYSNGALATSRYYQCDDATPVSYKTVDRDIDPSGAVKAERDSAGVQTTYSYDFAGRISSVSPTGEAAFNYSYTPAYMAGGTFTPAKVNATRGSTASEYQYDALGRLSREKQLMFDNSWSLRETLYDAMGRRQSASGFETMPAGGDYTFHPAHTTQYSYDPFSRPSTVQGADGALTTFAYGGARSIMQTVNMMTAAGPTAVSTLKVFDRQGRLSSVTEGYLSGTDQTTAYTYDVGNRLSSVSMATASGTQPRYFSYDNRGFLTSETHPENGTTSYLNYDAKGHPGLMLVGMSQTKFDLRYTYDSAERLVLLEGRNPYFPTQFRPLKQFTFGTYNAGADLANGKLQSAVRKNYDQTLGEVDVTETFHYADAAGHITSKDTSILGMNGSSPSQSVTQTYAYNTLGQRTNETYPTCTGAIRCGQAAWSNVTTSYTNGWLTSMSAPGTAVPSLADSVSYAPNGTVASVAHSNGVTDTITPDPNGLPRPQTISVTGWSACNPPSITSQSSDTSAASGNSVTLSVAATGAGTLHYLWHSSTSALSNDSPTLNTGPLTQSETYYVVVTDDCGTTQSGYINVNVCNGPSIYVQPANASVPYNQPANLTVSATDTPFSSLRFDWWIGTAPNMSQLAQTVTLSTDGTGNATSTLTTPNLTATTSYWVRVTDPCGFSVNSTTATVTVGSTPPAAPSNLTAAYNNSNGINITWSAVSGATHYLLERCATNCGGTTPSFSQIQDVATNSWLDGAVSQGATYVYRVRAAGSGGTSAYSNNDLATVIVLGAQSGYARLSDVQQLLTSLNALRYAAGSPAVTWTDILPQGIAAPAASGRINAAHLTSVRTAMDAVLPALSVAVPSSTTIASNGYVRAADFQNVQRRAQ